MGQVSAGERGRILNNPVSGAWRIKVYPEYLPSGFLNLVRVGVSAVVTLENTSPVAILTGVPAKEYVKPNEIVQLTATVANPTYVASAVQLTGSFGSSATLISAETTLADGHVANLLDNQDGGWRATLGNIRAGHSRQLRWRVRWSLEGTRNWVTTMASENAGTPSVSRLIVVDGTPPQGPSNLSSPTHPVGAFRCQTQVQMTWTAATDNLSGVEGYRVLFDQSPSTVPGGTMNLGTVTSYSQSLAPSANPYYFHIRAVDRSGNWGTTQHYGPIHVGAGVQTSYCVGAPNSTGAAAHIGGNAQFSIGANAYVLHASSLPPAQPSLYFAGPNAIQIPFGNGFRCVGGAVIRLGVVNTQAGSNSYALNFTNPLLAGVIQPGSTWRFQNWYRDPAAGGSGYNLTNGLAVTFCN